MLHVFIIHFAIAHLRRHNFPMDRTMFCGDTDLEAATEERPAWIARLRTNGALTSKTTGEAPAGRVVVSYAVGLCAVGLGIYLVIGGLMNAFLVSW